MIVIFSHDGYIIKSQGNGMFYHISFPPIWDGGTRYTPTVFFQGDDAAIWRETMETCKTQKQIIERIEDYREVAE